MCEIMKLGYMREAAGLPARKAQEEALRSAGIESFGEEAPVWLDLNPKRRKKQKGEEKPVPMPELAEAIRAMRQGEGDELVVAGPEILGGSRGEILKVMQAIGDKQGAVFDASVGKAIPWNPEALAVLDFATRGETATRSFAITKARKRRAELGRTGGPKKKIDKETHPKEYAKACPIWLNLDFTAEQAAAQIGVSVSTCYRYLPNREAPIFGRKSKP